MVREIKKDWAKYRMRPPREVADGDTDVQHKISFSDVDNWIYIANQGEFLDKIDLLQNMSVATFKHNFTPPCKEHQFKEWCDLPEVDADGKKRPKFKPIPLMDYCYHNGSYDIVNDIGYNPQKKDEFIIAEHGKRSINTYYPPPYIKNGKGSPTFFLSHIKMIMGDNSVYYREFINWLAHNVQFPGYKTSYAVVVVGKMGTGKSMVGDVCRRLAGKHNSAIVETKEIEDKYRDFIRHKTMLVVDELTIISAKVAENMKVLITAEDRMILRLNGEKSVNEHIYGNFLLFTNNENAIKITAKDRRYLVIGSEIEPMPESYFNEFGKWIENDDNMSALYHYLMEVDLSNFNPKKPAIQTHYKTAMAELTMTGMELKIANSIDRLDKDITTPREIYEEIQEHEGSYGGDDDLKLLKNIEINLSAVNSGFKVGSGNKMHTEHTKSMKGRDTRTRVWCVRNSDYWHKLDNFCRQTGNNDLLKNEILFWSNSVKHMAADQKVEYETFICKGKLPPRLSVDLDAELVTQYFGDNNAE